MAWPIANYRSGASLRNSRARGPILGLAIGWLALTALLPLAFEPATPHSGIAGTVSPEFQRERLKQLSEALMWPLGLAPVRAADQAETGPRPASCS